MDLSLLSRGAWIEILNIGYLSSPKSSLLSRGAWIEIENYGKAVDMLMSLLSRGAWIEMAILTLIMPQSMVAPLTRSVD